MTAREQGFLLLTSTLGNPNRNPLTVPQFRELTKRMRQAESPAEERQLQELDLMKIGCDSAFAERVISLLGDKEQLIWYLQKGKRRDCYPITRNSEKYPLRLHKTLAMEAPGVLWAKGDESLLKMPAISLVGSRQLREENELFAAEVGKQAALAGYVLISGNARGADTVAQESCLEHGGSVIKVVADSLEKHSLQRRVLCLSEEAFDASFSAQRALSRNRIIHALGQMTFVAQCTHGKGGTWDGTMKNLKNCWSPVLFFNDGSDAAEDLLTMGATAIDRHQSARL